MFLEDTLSAITTSRLITLFLAIFTAALAPAQNREYSVKIELQNQNPLVLADYSIQLLDSNRTLVATAFGDTLGAFSFRGIQSGHYLARLVDGTGYVVREEMVTLDGVSRSVELMAPQPQQAHAAAASISMRQLRNPPSKAAMKAFVASQKYSEAAQNQQAATALEKAIKLSPEFAEAHTNLAAQYMRLGEFKKAYEQATLGMEIAGPNTKDLTNLAAAAWALGRTAEALDRAQAAIRLDQGAMGAHYIVGSLLIGRPATVQEGLHHLELAAEKFPSAAQKLAVIRQTLAGVR